jgi:hypothetical protein
LNRTVRHNSGSQSKNKLLFKLVMQHPEHRDTNATHHTTRRASFLGLLLLLLALPLHAASKVSGSNNRALVSASASEPPHSQQPSPPAVPQTSLKQAHEQLVPVTIDSPAVSTTPAKQCSHHPQACVAAGRL